MAADGKAIVARYERLKSDAGTHFSHCERMAPYLCPSRVGITGPRAPGDSQLQEVTDSTTLMSAELMAQFIAGQIMNPAHQWGGMRMADPQARGNDAIQEWLE